MEQDGFDVRRLHGEVAAMRDLRARVLRPGLPREATHFPGDAADDTIHLGAFAGDQLVGVASLYVDQGIRLRGMAVEPAFRRRGVGAALIREAQQIATEAGQDLWCNGRDSAAGFYTALGWVAEGPGFTVPVSGPHHVMRWRPERNAPGDSSQGA